MAAELLLAIDGLLGDPSFDTGATTVTVTKNQQSLFVNGARKTYEQRKNLLLF